MVAGFSTRGTRLQHISDQQRINLVGGPIGISLVKCDDDQCAGWKFADWIGTQEASQEICYVIDVCLTLMIVLLWLIRF